MIWYGTLLVTLALAPWIYFFNRASDSAFPSARRFVASFLTASTGAHCLVLQMGTCRRGALSRHGGVTYISRVSKEKVHWDITASSITVSTIILDY